MRRGDAPPVRPALVGGLITLAVLGAAAATPWQFEMPQLLENLGSAPIPEMEDIEVSPPEVPVDESIDASRTGDILLTVILALLAAVAVALLWAGARKLLAALGEEPPPPLEPDDLDGGQTAGTGAGNAPVVPLEELNDAVTRALSHLERAGTPTDAVVAAWVALEEAAAEHGTERDPAQTPTEFTQAVLDNAPVPAADVATLTALYQQARFTDRDVDPAQVTRARSALVSIARSLDRSEAP